MRLPPRCGDTQALAAPAYFTDWRKLETSQRYLHAVESLTAAVDRLSVARDEAMRERRAASPEKWTAAPVDASAEALLARLQPYVTGGDDSRIPHFLFSRPGYAADLLALATADPDHHRLIGPEDLFSEIVRI